jgi:hypothetical protein
MVEVLLDGGFKLGHILEDTASDAVGSDAAEEALDLVEPRRRGRGEVHVETWMPLKPSLHLGLLVGGVIVSACKMTERLIVRPKKDCRRIG